MVETAAGTPPHGRPRWLKWLALVLGVTALPALLIALFPWDWMRGPVNRYITERTGRHFEITRRLDVKLGRPTRIVADGIEFANPGWARDTHLVKAQSAEIDVELLPLLARRIVLPRVVLRQPQLGLQIEEDGRRSWALGRDSSDPRTIPQIGVLVVDQGSMHFIAAHLGADIRTDFQIAGGSPTGPAAAMPLTFKARGTWKNEPFAAQGRTGNVLHLSAPLQEAFPMEVDVTAGRTALRANGSIASLATLEGANATFSLQGQNLADLYKLTGVVLPASPRYALRGRVSKQAQTWSIREISGKMGNSDLGGELSFDRGRKVPLLSGKLQSNALDFDDLAPLVGLPEQPRSASALRLPGARATAGTARSVSVAGGPARRVLPTVALDLSRLRRMDAEVAYSAARITHVKPLPLDRMSAHVSLKDGSLRLEPLNFGVAGGSLTGQLRINGNSNPAVAQASLDARSLELGKLFPTDRLTQASFGKIHGDIDLRGRGNSVAQMLGAASGHVALLMGQGQISNLLLEIAGLDGAEIFKFLSSGDRNVALRCAAAAFDVRSGLMSTRALVLDTADTVVYGQGQVSLAHETMDLTLRPYPKDSSILSLRSPLTIAGSFAAPRVGPDKGALAGRAGLALALAAINPLLALAATVETGPGENANCGAILRQAASPEAAARAAAMSQQRSARRAGP